MATVEVPNLPSKQFWRRSRILLWSTLAAFAGGVYIGVIVPPPWLAGFMGYVYFVALLVIALEFFGKKWNGDAQ